MKAKKRYKIVVYIPESYTEQLREAIGTAGAGLIGNYSHCTFTIQGIARFKPLTGAHPTAGEIGKLQAIAEDRIETVCEADKLQAVLKAIKDIHPDEEPATDVYPIEVFE